MATQTMDTVQLKRSITETYQSSPIVSITITDAAGNTVPVNGPVSIDDMHIVDQSGTHSVIPHHVYQTELVQPFNATASNIGPLASIEGTGNNAGATTNTTTGAGGASSTATTSNTSGATS